LPDTLDETYERTLREINKADSELAHRLFQCVAVASRPLRVGELAEFLAFDFSVEPIPQFREDWRLEDPVEAVLSTCSTLLSLVDVYPSQVIQFSHFSVKEFLMSSRFAEKRDTISRRYHISMTPAHTLVAQACLGILLHLDMNVTRDCLRKFPLAEYAAEQLVKHARFEGVSENAKEGLKQLFDGNKPHLAVWLWIYDTVQEPSERAERPLPPSGTPLHYAAFCGLHVIVKFLAIEHSEDVPVRSRVVDDWPFGNYTPLDLASREGHVEAARVLVEHGADVSAQDEDGSTPVHRLSESYSGNVDLAWFLVEHGADVTAQDNHGETPLHRLSGSYRENMGLARFLVEHGADAAAQDKHGSTPLHRLSESYNGNVDLAWFLLEHGANVTAQDKHGETPLHRLSGSYRGNMDLARFLVEHGADATAQDKHGSTPLHRLSESYNGNVDLARFLLEHGANVTAQDKHGETPLHRVSGSYGRNVDLARFLIQHGADATARDKVGSTPLHELSGSDGGNVDLARLLVEHDADVTARNEGGSTPLHELSQSATGNVDLARSLIEYGANVTAQDEDGLTPLHQASLNGLVHLARLFDEHGTDVTTQATPQIQQPTMT